MRFSLRLPALGFLTLGLVTIGVGCSDEAVGRAPERSVPPDNPAPVIDPNLLAYDPDQRTIHLYELIADPKTGRKGTWQVWLPEKTVAYPSGRTFQVPHGVAESEVEIRAVDPPGPPSPGIKLTAVPRKR
ncbi:MAG TPA: hypothetical protein VKD90_17180 [Gemmataceae bacterium]|nr:hypothetical protein [Gemmataceae bacterium]